MTRQAFRLSKDAKSFWLSRAVAAARSAIDGKNFDDTFGIPRETLDLLVERGLVFLTTFEHDGKSYGGEIIASSMNHAEMIAECRGLGEEVVGQVIQIIDL